MIVELGLLMAGVFVAIFLAIAAGIHYERWIWKRYLPDATKDAAVASSPELHVAFLNLLSAYDYLYQKAGLPLDCDHVGNHARAALGKARGEHKTPSWANYRDWNGQ